MLFSKAIMVKNGLQTKLMTLFLAPAFYHIHAHYIDEKCVFVYDSLSKGIFLPIVTGMSSGPESLFKISGMPWDLSCLQ